MVALAGWLINQPYYPIGVLSCSYGVDLVRLARAISHGQFQARITGRIKISPRYTLEFVSRSR
jgi:hypothetical protein